jgi:ATP-dependent Lhr-like helicase
MLAIGDNVEHETFGCGIVEDLLGDLAKVNFFGECLDIALSELTKKSSYMPVVEKNGSPPGNSEGRLFRRSLEAINLGVVPPDPSQLVELTIGSKPLRKQIQGWLQLASKDGLSKVVFGYYGAGKTHHLSVIRCMALQAGWAVAFLEFDPKSADPAKPHLVYRNLMSRIEFPEREDGSETRGFLGLVREVRAQWDSKCIKTLKYFSASPWFSRGFKVLLQYAHREDDPEYVAACMWLAGDNKALTKISQMGKAKKYNQKIPRMPMTNETSEIYVNHLVVVNELCRALGYKGLAIILDEAEHVRGYNVQRKNRANNFFDLLARSAHPPLLGVSDPLLNEHGISLPQYWKEGPHFALFVGLTEADTFIDPSVSLRDACVFLHQDTDRIFLSPPSVSDYQEWCCDFLGRCSKIFPSETEILASSKNCKKIALALGTLLSETDEDMVVLRIWIKLAGLVPCIILSGNISSVDMLISVVTSAAREATGKYPSLGALSLSSLVPAMMPDAWPIFFHYRKPRAIQEEATPPILRGASVLICSPTASGKTEAAVAPLYQRHISFKRSGLSTVYVVPTKALVNDMYFRLRDYFTAGGNVGIVLRYTGDHHDISKPDQAFILIATPEALDSLQLRRPHLFEGVRAVVIDEIHFLHGHARGQQLRYVVDRIRGNVKTTVSAKDVFQLVGMSASIDNIEQVKETWLGSDAIIVSNSDKRSIEMVLVSVPEGKLEETAHDIAKECRYWLESSGSGKALVFANTRNDAHILSIALREVLNDTLWAVFLHIGVLSASERDRVEGELKTARSYVCVATSTLEIGIDIGAIDSILLLHPPYSVSGFLQRIGRGNRKSDMCRVAALYRSDNELQLYEAMFNLAQAGSVDGLYEYDRPSVRYQQVLSLAWRGVQSEDPLTRENIVMKTGGHRHDDVVDDMLSQGYLRDRQGLLIPSDDIMDEADLRTIHSVIASSGRRQIIDAKSGEVVAEVEGTVKAGITFLDGHLKKVGIGSGGRIYLESKEIGTSVIARLPATSGRGGLSRLLCWELARLRKVDPRKWVLSEGYLRTWGGKANNKILSLLCRQQGIAMTSKPDDYGLSGLPSDIEITPAIVGSWAEKMSSDGCISSADASWFIGPSAYYGRLGKELQKKEALNSVPFDSFWAWVRACAE